MWNLHQPILTDSSRTRGPQNLLQGDFKKCPVYSTPQPKVTVITVTNAEYLSRNSESHPPALASLIQVTSLFCTRCSAVAESRGLGRGIPALGAGSPSSGGARVPAVPSSPLGFRPGAPAPTARVAAGLCPASCLILCALSVSSPSFSAPRAHLLCWFRLSLAFFKGRQTGQSCRVQFFQ